MLNGRGIDMCTAYATRLNFKRKFFTDSIITRNIYTTQTAGITIRVTLFFKIIFFLSQENRKAKKFLETGGWCAGPLSPSLYTFIRASWTRELGHKVAQCNGITFNPGRIVSLFRTVFAAPGSFHVYSGRHPWAPSHLPPLPLSGVALSLTVL